MASNDVALNREQTNSPRAGDSRAEEIKALARDAAELAIETLVDVMSSPDAKDAARVKAADIILQRGFGAPERKVETKMDIHVYDERAAHLSALQQLAELPRVEIDVIPNNPREPNKGKE